MDLQPLGASGVFGEMILVRWSFAKECGVPVINGSDEALPTAEAASEASHQRQATKLSSLEPEPDAEQPEAVSYTHLTLPTKA